MAMAFQPSPFRSLEIPSSSKFALHEVYSDDSTIAGPPPPSLRMQYFYSGSAILAILLASLLGTFSILALIVLYFCRRSVEGGAAIHFPGRIMRRGLRKDVVQAFPVLVWSDLKANREYGGAGAWDCCAICLGDLEGVAKIRLLPRCHHCFHLDCIDVWLMSHTTCPVCRGSLIPEVKIPAKLGSSANNGDSRIP